MHVCWCPSQTFIPVSPSQWPTRTVGTMTALPNVCVSLAIHRTLRLPLEGVHRHQTTRRCAKDVVEGVAGVWRWRKQGVAWEKQRAVNMPMVIYFECQSIVFTSYLYIIFCCQNGYIFNYLECVQGWSNNCFPMLWLPCAHGWQIHGPFILKDHHYCIS